MLSVNAGSGGGGGTAGAASWGRGLWGLQRGATYFEGTASKDLLMELGAMGQS